VNYTRIALAALGATVVYFILGGLLFAMTPMVNEFRKYPAVYRSQQDMKRVMPFGMVAILLSMAVLAALYARLYRGGSGVAEGARFGALIGGFAIGSFVIHNYVNLNIGLKLTIEQAGAYLVQWIVAGIVIGSIYHG
jgi:hypothetical protein